MRHTKFLPQGFKGETGFMKKILETERLFLREMSMDDFDALYKVLADREIMQHYPYIFDEERVRSWIERNMNRYKDNGFGLLMEERISAALTTDSTSVPIVLWRLWRKRLCPTLIKKLRISDWKMMTTMMIRAPASLFSIQSIVSSLRIKARA